MIAFIQRIYSRLTGVPSSAIRMEFDPSDTGDFGPVGVNGPNYTRVNTRPSGPPPWKPNRGRVDEDAATRREAQEEDY